MSSSGDRAGNLCSELRAEASSSLTARVSFSELGFGGVTTGPYRPSLIRKVSSTAATIVAKGEALALGAINGQHLPSSQNADANWLDQGPFG